MRITNCATCLVVVIMNLYLFLVILLAAYYDTQTIWYDNKLKLLFNINLKQNDILYTNSSTETKHSYHIIVAKYNLSLDDMKYLRTYIQEALTKKNINYENCLDPAVYGSSSQCFRLIGSSKLGKNNKKKMQCSIVCSVRLHNEWKEFKSGDSKSYAARW